MAIETTVRTRSGSSGCSPGPVVLSRIRKLPFVFALRNVLQLVGIAHDVDHSDFAGDDFESDRENVTLGESCHAPRQPIDHCGAQIGNRLLPLTSETSKERQDPGAADNWVERGLALAATVGVQHSVLREDVRQGFDVAGAIGVHERLKNYAALLRLNLKSRS